MRPIDADAFKKYIDAQEGRPFIGCTVGEAMKILIDEQPTMQPERKMGKWTLGFDNIYMEKYYYCSRCGCRKYGRHEPIDYFCSNCGAKMTISK